MRASTARLTNSPVRLADLQFPQVNRLIHRTRLAFIHLDNLLAYAKRDRDGRIDGYLAAHLPDECLLLFFRKGEAVNAASLHTAGRQVITITEALKRMRTEVERGDLTYCAAPMEQLAWMYAACAGAYQPRGIDVNQPEKFFPLLQQEKVTGVLELIANGRVSYLKFDQGKYLSGHFCDKPENISPARYLESLFDPGPPPSDTKPAMSAGTFPAADDLPAQAATALVNTYRELCWRIVAAVEAAGTEGDCGDRRYTSSAGAAQRATRQRHARRRGAAGGAVDGAQRLGAAAARGGGSNDAGDGAESPEGRDPRASLCLAGRRFLWSSPLAGDVVTWPAPSTSSRRPSGTSAICRRVPPTR